MTHNTEATATTIAANTTGGGTTTFYDKRGQVEALLLAFQECTLPHSAWTHAAHLTVALWYLTRFPHLQATELIRNGIKRYNAANGIATTPTSGYHETITLFWILAIGKYLAVADTDVSIERLANRLIDCYRDQRFPLRYYSKELLMSAQARATWVDPDLLPLG